MVDYLGSATGPQVDEAALWRHQANTDIALDQGNANEVQAADLRALLDKDHVFLSETNVAPATAGEPSLAEIQALVTANTLTSTTAYYTADNVDDINNVKYAYSVSGMGEAILIYNKTPNAIDIDYDNTTSGLVATNVNSAIDELQANKQAVWQTANVTTDVNPALPYISYYTNTGLGNIIITLPDVTANNDGDLYRFTMSSNGNETIITTVGGTQLIGEFTTQQIVEVATGFTVQANFAELKYEIIQDNRGSARSGFDDPNQVDMAFNNVTRTLSLNTNIVGKNYTFTTSNGVGYGKQTDSVIITDTNGIHAVYYDNNGALQSQSGLNREQLYDLIKTSVPVAYILWESGASQKPTFVTRVLKDKSFSIGAWAKNAFDVQIYPLSGFTQFDDPSVGGTVTPSSSLNTSAQFGVSAGVALWTDKKHQLPVKNTGDSWVVIYKDGANIRSTTKTAYSFLLDTDFTLTTEGRVVYNNNGVPTVASSGSFVWYFVGISNDIDTSRRVVSFMGENQYSSAATANSALADERATVESSLSIRQEFATVYAVLIETKSSFTNAVKSRIVDFKTLETVSGGSTGAVIPADLINGGDASTLHIHNAGVITVTPTGNLISTNTQSALEELQTDIDNLNTISIGSNSTSQSADGVQTVFTTAFDLSPNTTLVFVGLQDSLTLVSSGYTVNLNDVTFTTAPADGHYVYIASFAGAFNGGSGGSAWGSLTGILSTQTDLQSELDAKQNILPEGAFTAGDKTKLDNITDSFKGYFANATARDAAVPSPADGDYVIQNDTDSVWYYNGVTWIDTGSTATGDMLKSIYDPSNIADNVYDVDNHISGIINKVYTASEQANSHSPYVIGTKTVDENNLADGFMLEYNSTSGNLEYHERVDVTFTSNDGQTVFTLPTPWNKVVAHVNGIIAEYGYTYNSGTGTITFTLGLNDGDILRLRKVS